MGGCVSIQISCDQVLNNVCNCLSRNRDYIHGLEKNLAALTMALEQIEQRQEDLLRKIEAEERRGLQPLAVVQGWASRVENIVSRANEVLDMRSVQAQKLCLNGYCSKSPVSNYSYGKKVMDMVEEIKVLTSQGDFAVVAERFVASRVEERPTRPMVGMEPMVETVWNSLMDDEIGILGLHGMGGVGKTTILSHINNRLSRAGNDYDVVIWVVVSKDLQIHKIQDEIWENLRSDNEEWKQKTESRKASAIFNILKEQKFVLLLDDIWSKVDLTKIGIPFPSRENGCKIVFTTRLKEVCGRMGVDSDMEVRCLAPNDAWDLFAKKVGETTLESHPDITMLARTVAKKCRGLPLALNVIGETMAYKRTVQEWRLAIDILTSSAAEFSGMEDEILPILKYSYDNLKSEQLKMCFQYCALFPEDHNIEKDDLVDYWIGEGFMDGKQGRAENQGYEIIGNLVRSCLLMEENQETVKMHDVVREMALWIASDFGKQKENFIVQSGLWSGNIPETEKWKVARRISLMFNNVHTLLDAPESPHLITLLLQKNHLAHIPSSFFLHMPRLVVLDLSGNVHLNHLSEEILNCVSLQYLNLSCTRIKLFPVGLLKLKQLIYLNLEYTRMVEHIFGISSLRNLKVLRLVASGFKGDPRVVEELQLLESLQTLTITISFVSVLKRFLSNERSAKCTRILRIENLYPQSSEISFVTSMDSLRELYLEHTDISEISIERSTLLSLDSPTTPFFPNLSHVSLQFCKGFRDLSWLLFAPNLTILRVLSASQLEEIINKEKAEQQSLIPFQTLKELHLENAKMLKYIHWSPLPFPCLQKILVKECSKLTRLPLDSTSVIKGDLVIEAQEPWIQCLEWEDEATRDRFLPSIKAVPVWGIDIDG